MWQRPRHRWLFQDLISSGLCIFSRLISQKLLEQEGQAQSVISAFSWAIVEYFPSEGHLPSPRIVFSSSVSGDISRGWYFFPLNKPWILDPSLSMKRQMGVFDFSSSGGKVDEVVKIDRVAVNLAIFGLKIFGLSASPLR